MILIWRPLYTKESGIQLTVTLNGCRSVLCCRCILAVWPVLGCTYLLDAGATRSSPDIKPCLSSSKCGNELSCEHPFHLAVGVMNGNVFRNKKKMLQMLKRSKCKGTFPQRDLHGVLHQTGGLFHVRHLGDSRIWWNVRCTRLFFFAILPLANGVLSNTLKSPSFLLGS